MVGLHECRSLQLLKNCRSLQLKKKKKGYKKMTLIKCRNVHPSFLGWDGVVEVEVVIWVFKWDVHRVKSFHDSMFSLCMN